VSLPPEFEDMRSGAMPADWHEWNDTGYVPGGADRLAEAILSEDMPADVEEPRFYRTDEETRRGNARGKRGLPQGYGDPRING
jgi:hypothetical protein